MSDQNPTPDPQPGAQPTPPNPYASTQPAPPLTAEQDKLWASLAHFGGALAIFAGFSGYAGLLAVLPALLIFLILGKRGALTKQESKEALNFQITIVGAMIVWAILSAILLGVLWIALPWAGYLVVAGVFGLVGWALVVVDVVFSIIGGVKVNGGGSYRYPFALRLVK